MNTSKINSRGSMDPHPYYPPNLALLDFISNDIPVSFLIFAFASASVAVLWCTSVLARVVRPSISNSQRWMAMWFMLCGCIHFFFEGYFAINNAHMPTRTHLFGQLWKEYAKSDRRYITRDSFIVCMETVTAFCWGPLSFLISWLIIKDNPLRHSLQIIVSMGQLYGDVLYYATFFFDESIYSAVYCRPEAIYFWVYFITLNGFWIVIPSWVIIHSAMKITNAFPEGKVVEKRV